MKPHLQLEISHVNLHHGNGQNGTNQTPLPRQLLVLCLHTTTWALAHTWPPPAQTQAPSNWVPQVRGSAWGKERLSKLNLMSVHKGFLSASVLTQNRTHSAEGPLLCMGIVPSGRMYSKLAILCWGNKNSFEVTKCLPSYTHRCAKRKFLSCFWCSPGLSRKNWTDRLNLISTATVIHLLYRVYVPNQTEEKRNILSWYVLS